MPNAKNPNDEESASSFVNSCWRGRLSTRSLALTLPLMLAMVNLQNPTLWAVIVGWIISVVLHELAHGVVGYLGGDHTIRERGGLTLNPLQYIDPLLTIALPLFFWLMGGVPLPGGVTYVRTDLLRSRLWATAVSLAGPATNFLLFVLLALPFHPRFGWIHPSLDVAEWSQLQLFLATMVVLQFVVCLLNMIPIPPLDGFGAIRPYFDESTQRFLSSRQVNTGCLLVLFLIMPHLHGLIQSIYNLEDQTLSHLGFNELTIGLIGSAFNKVIFNQ